MVKMGQKKIRVALIQLGVHEGGVPWKRVEELFAQAEGADLIMLPELWPVGYFDFASYRKRAETLFGETFDLIKRAAQQIGAFILGGSFIETDGGRFYNTAILFDREGRLLGTYRKQHLLSYRSREREILTPGRDSLVVPTEIGTLGVAICYDLRFPELFRGMAAEGAEIFLVPAAWPIVRMEAWEALTRARAVENQAFLLGCNATGKGLLGRSAVVDPWGVTRARLGGEEGVLRAELDLILMRAFRDEFSAWRER